MKQELISQYRAALKMLIKVTDECPDELWTGTNYHDAYWRIVYHTLFYTAFYLSKDEAAFIPWANHGSGMQRIGVPVADQHPSTVDLIYSKADLRDYAEEISRSLEDKVDPGNFLDPSGFYWLPMNKFELHL